MKCIYDNNDATLLQQAVKPDGSAWDELHPVCLGCAEECRVNLSQYLGYSTNEVLIERQ